jgi:hypothetical protein
MRWGFIITTHWEGQIALQRGVHVDVPRCRCDEKLIPTVFDPQTVVYW